MTSRENETMNEIIAENSEASKDTAHALNKVIAQTLNSRNIFRDAAGKASTAKLSSQFVDWKHKRDQFALDMQHWVTRLGHEPAVEPNATGWLHRQFVKARAAIESDTNYALVQEMQREEQSMIDVIDEALEVKELPTMVRDRLLLEKKEAAVIKEMMHQLEGTLEPDSYVDLNRQQN